MQFILIANKHNFKHNLHTKTTQELKLPLQIKIFFVKNIACIWHTKPTNTQTMPLHREQVRSVQNTVTKTSRNHFTAHITVGYTT